jgi:hypothetical protein
MDTKRTLLLLAVLWLPSASTALSQTSRSDPVDFHTRYGTAINLDLPNRWEGALEYELRMVDNASTYRGSYFTAELGRGVTRSFTLMGNYRLAMVNEGTFHRFAAGGQVGTRLGDARLSFRSLMQHQQQSFHDEDLAGDADTYLRTRFRVRYPLADRVRAYASTEPFFTFAEGEYPIDNVRNTAGLQIEYRRRRRLDIYYIYRPDYARSYNRTFHTLGMNLDFEVDLFKRRNR